MNIPLTTEALDAAIAAESFTGVLTVDVGDRRTLERCEGFANRALGVRHTSSTRISGASGNKGFTALAIMRLVETGTLSLGDPVRPILGEDLPLIDDAVTIEHLLTHTSGIGDYLDEDETADMTEYALPVPVHRLATAEDYLSVLTGHPTAFPAGARFAYNNGGYVVLSLLIERAGGADYHEQVRRCVLEPAGMVDTAFLRSDELPASAARGYLGPDGLRTNVLHLPVVGVGDGGAYSTAGDLHRLWDALGSGRVVSPEAVALMVAARSDWPEESRRYGLGFHVHRTGEAVWLEGYDAGVSFTSLHEPERDITYTVISNWTDGAWPIVELLNRRFGL